MFSNGYCVIIFPDRLVGFLPSFLHSFHAGKHFEASFLSWKAKKTTTIETEEEEEAGSCERVLASASAAAAAGENVLTTRKTKSTEKRG
jgi:hypothetical protein